MRDPEIMKRLLQQAAAKEDGRILCVVTFGGGHREFHHAQLLADDGLFEQTGKHGFRITARGYDSLECFSDSARWQKFKEFFATGMGIIDATRKVFDAVQKFQ